MIRRASLLMLFALALGSCSYVIPIRAGFENGKLVFTGDDMEVRSYPSCLGEFAVVGEDGIDAWRFEVPLEIRQAKSSCGPNLPITYGDAPRDAKVTTPARPLEHGKLYFITGYAGNSYDGAFRYEKQTIVQRRITNMTPDIATRNRALGFGGMFESDGNSAVVE